MRRIYILTTEIVHAYKQYWRIVEQPSGAGEQQESVYY